MIQVTEFSKSYAGRSAVSNLSFNVQPGQILGLVGPNGAGKSTTLGALAGIVDIGGGSLVIAGHDIQSETLAAKAAVGYIPDDPPLFEELTVWEHLVLTASIYGVDNPAQHSKQLLDLFDLTGKEHVPVRTLSRGMRQKTSVICAYLHNPPVLLFDEPMVGLDPAGIRALQRSMTEHAKNGKAIIISSHMLSLVQNLCSHILVLHEGHPRWHGTVGELAEQGESALETLFFSITEDNGVR